MKLTSIICRGEMQCGFLTCGVAGVVVFVNFREEREFGILFPHHPYASSEIEGAACCPKSIIVCH